MKYFIWADFQHGYVVYTYSKLVAAKNMWVDDYIREFCLDQIMKLDDFKMKCIIK